MTRAKDPARRPTNPRTSRVWRTGRLAPAHPRATVPSNRRAAWPATSRSSSRSPSSDRFAVSPAAKTTPRLTRRSSPSGRRRELTFSGPRHGVAAFERARQPLVIFTPLAGRPAQARTRARQATAEASPTHQSSTRDTPGSRAAQPPAVVSLSGGTAIELPSACRDPSPG
jgi:hypothetical protein